MKGNGGMDPHVLNHQTRGDGHALTSTPKIPIFSHAIILYSYEKVWSSGQSSWLQIQRPGFDSQLYHIFREVVGLERRCLEEKVAAPV
jgi:hypothetical protein